MLGRRTLIGLTSPDVRTVPGARSRVTAHTRVLESAAAMVTAPATIEPITSKTPATRRKSNQLGVFARRGAGEVVATGLRPFQLEVGSIRTSASRRRGAIVGCAARAGKARSEHSDVTRLRSDTSMRSVAARDP